MVTGPKVSIEEIQWKSIVVQPLKFIHISLNKIVFDEKRISGKNTYMKTRYQPF